MKQNPIPPWDRHPNSATVQTLTGDGAISLVQDTTFLDQTDAAPGGSYAITLPDGNYRGETHAVYVPSANELTTASFEVTGTFVGFDTLTMDTNGHSAILQWDGDGWHMLGGNATKA